MGSLIDAGLGQTLYRRARAERWNVPLDALVGAVEASLQRTFAGRNPGSDEVQRSLKALHLEDLALACACAEGNEQAWELFIREYRPRLYRAADAIDPTGGARELADSLYAELFGLSEKDGVRRPLFRYYHGRSSLATWIRAVLAQRHVDRLRAVRRLDPLPPDESPLVATVSPEPGGESRSRYERLMRESVAQATAGLSSRDRLRLACYYAQQLTLAEIGRALGEHEGTVSRHIARTRRTIREEVERRLRNEVGMSDEEITECFASVVENPGALDVAELIGSADGRKNAASERS
jgi:RNA polymerase sigma-70 factor (ECF subfamily)